MVAAHQKLVRCAQLVQRKSHVQTLPQHHGGGVAPHTAAQHQNAIVIALRHLLHGDDMSIGGQDYYGVAGDDHQCRDQQNAGADGEQLP